MVNDQLADDWNLPLISCKADITFPNSKEEIGYTTQELFTTISLPNNKGIKIVKTQSFRYSLSKNIPYGFLLGIHSLFNLGIGLKRSPQGYVPYFDEENLTPLDYKLEIDDFGRNKISFLNITEESEIDLSTLPEPYRKFSSVFQHEAKHGLPPHRVGLDCGIDLVPGASLHRGPIYPMNPLQIEEANKYIEENLQKGFIRPSKSPAAYPVTFQKKKDGTLRFCVDYRRLNAVTIKDSYPLPLYMLFFEQVKGSKYFSKLDLKSAYNLIRIREGDEYKTAFRTRKGQYEYLVMPFGLTNAPAVFQRFINYVMSDYLDKFVVVYLDDILIFSKTLGEHITHVSKVLQVLQDNYLIAKLEKCVFHVPEIEFLGHIISGTQIKTDPTKIAAVKDWPVPNSLKELQSFLGFCNYYRRFIKNFSIVASILFKLIRKDSKFVWGPEQQEAFNKLKELLTSAPVLSLPDPNKQFVLETDASHFALGCVLSQYDDEHHLHPVYYYSRSFTKPERNYSISDKELLAIIAGLEEWRHLLIGTKEPILILTDHRNLLFATKPQRLSLRQARWQEVLSYYNYHIKYRPGSVNVKADRLSRRPDLLPTDVEVEESIIDPNKCSFYCFLNLDDFNPLLDSIRKEQHKDNLFSSILKVLGGDDSYRNKVRNIDLSKFSVKKNLLLFNNLICVPLNLRYDVLSAHHDYSAAGHLGIHKTSELISRNFY